jgi:hypothetical protein
MFYDRRDIMQTLSDVAAIEREVPLRERLALQEGLPAVTRRQVHGRAVLECLALQDKVVNSLLAVMKGSRDVDYYRCAYGYERGIRDPFSDPSYFHTLASKDHPIGTVSGGGDTGTIDLFVSTKYYPLSIGCEPVVSEIPRRGLAGILGRTTQSVAQPAEPMSVHTSGAYIFSRLHSGDVINAGATIAYGGATDNRGTNPTQILTDVEIKGVSLGNRALHHQTSYDYSGSAFSYTVEDFDKLCTLGSAVQMIKDRSDTTALVAQYYC